MTIPLAPLLLSIAASFAPARRKRWEELAAVERDDLELARLNRANTRDPVVNPWTGPRLIFRGTQ